MTDPNFVFSHYEGDISAGDVKSWEFLTSAL